MADKTIYVVTSGVYSDYRILAVFANEIAAQTFIKGRERPKDCRIEKYPLNTEVCLNTYYVLFYPDRDNDPWFVCEIPYNPIVGKVRRLEDREVWYQVNIEAKNQESALKTANEKIMQAIAEGK